MADAPLELVESRAPRLDRASWASMLLFAALWGFVCTAGDHHGDDPFAPWAQRGARGALVCLALVATTLALGDAISRRRFRRADAGGFAWRDAFGARRTVPWAAVGEVRESVRGLSGDNDAEVVLMDGRVISLVARWPGFEALRARLARGATDAAYRAAAGADPSRAAFAYGSRQARAAAFFAVFSLTAIVGFLCLPAVIMIVYPLHVGDRFDPSVALHLTTLAALLSVVWWRYVFERSGWRDGMLVVDREGLSIRGADARQVAWRDVRAVVANGLRIHLETDGGLVPVSPGLDGAIHFLERVFREAPSEVVRDFLRAHHRRNRLRPTERPDGTRHHHAHTREHRRLRTLLTLPAAYLAAYSLTLLVTPDRATSTFGYALAALSIPIAYGVWMARFAVTVDDAACTWRTVLRGRRFTWGEVIDATVAGLDARVLTLKLRDGATFTGNTWAMADGDLLVDAVRRRCAAVLRETP